MQLIARLFYLLFIPIFCVLFLKFNTALQQSMSKTIRQKYIQLIDIENRTVSKSSRGPWNQEEKHHRKQIPRHIHQYWNGKYPPLHLMQQCRDLHPTWNYTLWTPESIQTSTSFHNRAIYNRFSTQQINGQSDVVRYSVLREFGGVYLDADTVCLRPLDDLLQYGFFAGYHSKDNAGTRENNKHHPNRELVASAVMGSIPQHPLTVRLTDDLHNTYQNGMAWSTVGPGHLTRTLRNCPKCNISGDIIILPYYAFVPYHHEENDILKAYADKVWKLPKLRTFNPYAMNLWGTTFNKWQKLSTTVLPPISNHTISNISRTSHISTNKFRINLQNEDLKQEGHTELLSRTMNECLEFVHITKTGGTAIESIAAASGLQWGACQWRPELPTCNGLPAHIREKRRTGGFWHDPLTHYDCHNLFTIVRNPYTRMLSEFYCPWTGYTGAKISARVLNEWTQALIQRVSTGESGNTFHAIPQYKYVYDLQNNQRVRHVLKFETLERDFNTLMQFYNMSLRLPRDKINQSHRKRTLTVADFSKTTLQAINEVYAKDFEQFQYTFETDPKNLDI